MKLSFRDTFAALKTQTAISQSLFGVNEWREPSADFNASSFASERVTPPSKKGQDTVGETRSVWYTLHFKLLIPAVRELGKRAFEANLQAVQFSKEEVPKYVRAFDDICGHLEQIHSWGNELHRTLDDLPENPDDLDYNLAQLLEDEVADPPANHIFGRLLQAYYAVQTGEYSRFGLPAETGDYFGEKDIFERTKRYAFKELLDCPFSIDETGRVSEEISGTDILKFYRWFASPNVVEFVLPNFTGAAEAAADDLSNFLDDVYDRTSGDIDLRYYQVSEKLQESLHSNHDLLRRIGFMAEMVPAIDPQHQFIPGVNSLTELAKQIWTKEQRNRVWADPDRLSHLTSAEQTEFGRIRRPA